MPAKVQWHVFICLVGWQHESLWLVRDRLGIKPSFFCHSPNVLLFGSEIKAILEYPLVSRRVDLQALAYFLGLNYTPAPFHPLRSIRQLLPGHYALVGTDGKFEDVEYWDLHYKENYSQKSEQEYLEEFDQLLQDSVKLRLVSDVPFGAFFSGGLIPAPFPTGWQIISRNR